MIELTEDITTIITDRVDDKIFYENTDGRKWWIAGTCVACGECESFPDNFFPGITINQINIRKLSDGSYEEWIRVLTWNSHPGTPSACVESGFSTRKDIPMTPDGINSPSCTLYGEWIV